CRGLHAEQNAIIQAALYGVDIHAGTLYCTNQPCSICAKMLINAGIKEVVIGSGYPDEMAMKFFEESGITVRTEPVKGKR
ncbi:MAG TPA: deaminase, partial [Candidatus Omnitrophota bacterium]|nr:deaminase [Candidatus Omnitrophota bacterium]